MLNIGKLKIDGHTILAPLAGITNLPFRRIVKRCGCSLVCSEMVSVKGILYNSEKTISLLKTVKEERPVSIQIFGAEPSEMAKGAAFIEKLGNADVIDINFGCSVKKVVKTGAGAALMKNTADAENVIKAVRDAVSLPLTIKIRSGWDSSGIQAFKIAESAQKIGVDAVIFHPRTASQGFKGKADWSLIKKLKENLSIPLIGNGDILSAADAVKMMQMTKCDGVMVGRGAMSNPFILSDIEKLISGKVCENRSSDEIFSVMKELLTAYTDYFGEKQACLMARSRLAWFVKGLPECSKFRQSLNSIETLEQGIDTINNYQIFLDKRYSE